MASTSRDTTTATTTQSLPSPTSQFFPRRASCPVQSFPSSSSFTSNSRNAYSSYLLRPLLRHHQAVDAHTQLSQMNRRAGRGQSVTSSTMTPSGIPEPLIWINGWPGVGKLSIAETLVMLIGAERATLINYQLLCPSDIAPDHPDYQAECRKHRAAAFAKHVSAPMSLGKVVIFTDFQPATEQAARTAAEYRDAAAMSGRAFVPIYLTCEVEENVLRIKSLGRLILRSRRPGDLVSSDKVRKIRQNKRLFRFEGGGLGVGSGPAPDLELDVTKMEAHEAAMRIRCHVTNVFQSSAAAMARARSISEPVTKKRGHEPVIEVKEIFDPLD